MSVDGIPLYAQKISAMIGISQGDPHRNRRNECVYMRHTIWKLWNGITSLLVLTVVILAIALAGVRVLGLQPLAVLSGSMEPEYPVGSLIYVKKVDTNTLRSGDVITFRLDGTTLATHRIVAVTEEGFRTKGDANAAEDGGMVPPSDVMGAPVLTIPGLGYLANFLQNPPGNYLAVFAGAVILFALFLPELMREEKTARQP